MIAVEVCTCATWDNEVRLCELHHKYFRAGRELTSVSKVLRTTWPIPADYTMAPVAILENARQRGSETDALFSAYVNGTLTRIPAGTRADVVDLFFKVKLWADTVVLKGNAQVILANDEIAGTCDVLTDDCIYDLKTTYAIAPTYPLQLGLYGLLHAEMYGRYPEHLRIIWLTKRFAEPKIVELPLVETLEDAMVTLAMYKVVKRRAKL